MRKLFLIVFLFTTSCYPFGALQKIELPIAVKTENINKQIILRVSRFSNTYKTTDAIFLELIYNSGNQITFPNDYNLVVYQKTKTEWLSLPQLPIVRQPEDDVVLSPNSFNPAANIVVVHPDLPNLAVEYHLRIYVIGLMKSNETNVPVSAFAEIKIVP